MGYTTPREAFSPPRRNSCGSPNGASVQRSTASFPGTLSPPGHRTPAKILVLETEALKASLRDLQPSPSGRDSTTVDKGKHSVNTS